jgi:hypothetical protein
VHVQGNEQEEQQSYLEEAGLAHVGKRAGVASSIATRALIRAGIQQLLQRIEAGAHQRRGKYERED